MLDFITDVYQNCVWEYNTANIVNWFLSSNWMGLIREIFLEGNKNFLYLCFNCLIFSPQSDLNVKYQLNLSLMLSGISMRKKLPAHSTSQWHLNKVLQLWPSLMWWLKTLVNMPARLWIHLVKDWQRPSLESEVCCSFLYLCFRFSEVWCS